MANAVIFGASRQGVVVLQVLRAVGHAVVGFVDEDAAKRGAVLGGVTVFGGLFDAPAELRDSAGWIAAIGNNDARLAVATRLRERGLQMLNAVHPSAVVMPDVSLGTGDLICAGAVVVTGTRLENDVVINTGATVDHDSVVREGAYVSPGVHTAGCVDIGRGAFIGAGSVLGPGIRVGDGAIVGAGSLVLRDVPPRVLVHGSPARVVRQLTEPIDWRRVLGGRTRGG
jgi:sugar O-acyltransferase (sialic acid O-acetyltransferase NeuD family)